MNIALVAHDSRKRELIEWVRYNANELKRHNLFATGTTGKLIMEKIDYLRSRYKKTTRTEKFKDYEQE